MFERVGAEESAALTKLARRVRDELAAAGLPVVAPELDPGARLAGRPYRWGRLSRPRVTAS
jgi:hypothetical protein